MYRELQNYLQIYTVTGKQKWIQPLARMNIVSDKLGAHISLFMTFK